MALTNTLYYGDNLSIMRKMPKESIDLIYLDPPFNSKRTYNILYTNMTGRPVPEQEEAFCDTWELDAEKERMAQEMPILMRQHGIDDYYVEFWRYWIQALRHTQPHLLAYLIYMVERLLYMKILLRPTGSIYLHCDQTASHYIKIMMDGIFGYNNFRNEIIWKRTTSHSDAKRWSPIADIILYYSKTDKFIWNPQYVPHDEKYIANKYRYKETDGRRYRLDNMTSPNPRPNMMYEWKGYSFPVKGWRFSRETMMELDTNGRIWYPDSKAKRPQLKRYLDEMPGTVISNIWTDISPINSQAKERLGYPTQKPIMLLDRIIQASSNKGDVIFDPFCGCGTTIYAAHKRGRRWIGCDIAILALRLIKDTLTGDTYRLVEGIHYTIAGIPVSVEQAQELFHHSPTDFQSWLVETSGGFPTVKKSGDKGVDGRIYFETREGLKDMVLSVKGGAIGPDNTRELRGVLARESNAELSGFLSLRTPTKAMREDAATAGMYFYEGVHYPRMQFLTVREILEEKRTFQTPTKIGIKRATGQMSLAL